VDSSAGYPVEFSPNKNMAWKAPVPYGQSSPVVVGTRLYGTASEGDRLITFCLDTRTGRELWRQEVRRERVQVVYKANDPASPTPAADEKGVVAFFPEFGLVAYNNAGQMRWTTAWVHSRTSTECQVRQSSKRARSCSFVTSTRVRLSLRSTARADV
jgi:outer membrane protein assembly factor BamB